MENQTKGAGHQLEEVGTLVDLGGGVGEDLGGGVPSDGGGGEASAGRGDVAGGVEKVVAMLEEVTTGVEKQ
ncbi:hypothetical protein TB2_044925 [Malus domestica]